MTPEKSPTVRRNPAPLILACAVGALIVYYVLIVFTGALNTSTDVKPAGATEPDEQDYLTLQIRVQDIDLTNRVVSANILPIPHGALVGDKAGEMSQSLRIEISSGGVTTSVVTYPGQSIVDPTAMSLSLERGDSAYPFDRPFANFHLSVQNDETGRSVPFAIAMENSARPWILTGSVDHAVTEGGKVTYPIMLDGNRDALSIALVSFYVLAILITTLMAVVTIGSALLRHTLEFSNII